MKGDHLDGRYNMIVWYIFKSQPIIKRAQSQWQFYGIEIINIREG